MSSIKPPSQVELTRLKSIAERLSMAWSTMSVSEMLSEIVSENRFVRNPAVVSSFGADSAVLLHMISQIQPEAQVVFLDTGFHFKETIRYRNHLISTFGLKNVRTASVDPLAIKRRDPTRRLHLSQPDQCCQLRKVSVFLRKTFWRNRQRGLFFPCLLITYRPVAPLGLECLRYRLGKRNRFVAYAFHDAAARPC